MKTFSTADMIDKDNKDYLEGLQEFVMLCDIKGYRNVMADLEALYPESYLHMRAAIVANTTVKRVAALLRSRDQDQMT